MDDKRGPEPSPPSSKVSTRKDKEISFSFESERHFVQADLEAHVTAKSGGEEQSQPTATVIFSAAQFRRIERSHRQLEVCCDVMKGHEEYKKPAQAVGWALAAWFVLPVVAVTLCFGLIPFTAETSSAALSSTAPTWRSLWPWAVTSAVLACLMTEIFSFVAFEIEYGIVVAEELPWMYIKAGTGSIAGALVGQSIIFGCNAQQGWLAALSAAFLAVVCVLWTDFARHAPGTDDTRSVLRRAFLGLFVGTVGGAIIYTVLAAVFAQYHLVGGGAVGYIIAILLPLLRRALQAVLESRWGLQWGGERDMLCAGPVPAVLLESLHAVYLCLVAGASATPIELAVMAAVQLAIFYSDLHPRPFVWSSPASCCAQDSKIDIYHYPEEADKQLGSEGGTSKGTSPGPPVRWWCQACWGGEELRATGSPSSGSTGSASSADTLSPPRDSDSPQPPASSWEEDVEECRRICSSVLSATLGLLAPVTLLVIAAILDSGPNRSLFREAVRLWKLSSLQPSQDVSSYWLAADGLAGSDGPFVGNLLCVAAFHCACLVWAARTYAAKGHNVVGTLASLILTHHSITFSSAALFSFLAMISAVFGPYGTNLLF